MRRAGFLDAIGVRVLLDDVGSERLSGTLRISHDAGEIDIYFTHGEIYYAAFPEEPPVEELLADAGVISREQRDTLGVNTARGRYLGRALVGDRPDVDHRAISAFVRSRTVERVGRVLGLRNGKFLFLAHEHHPAGVIDAVPVGTVLEAADTSAGRSLHEPGEAGAWAGLSSSDRAETPPSPRRTGERQPRPLRRFGSQPVQAAANRRPAPEADRAAQGDQRPEPAPASRPTERAERTSEPLPPAPQRPTGPVERAPQPAPRSRPHVDTTRPPGAQPPEQRAESPDDVAAGSAPDARPGATDDGARTSAGPATTEPADTAAPAVSEQQAQNLADEESRAAMARSSVRRRALQRLIRSIRT